MTEFLPTSIWPTIACFATIQVMAVIITVIMARRFKRNQWLWGALAVFLGIWAVIILALTTPSKPKFPAETPLDVKPRHDDRRFR